MGRRRKETLLDMALTSTWAVAASIAAGMLCFGFVLIPAFFAHNPYLKMAAAGLKPIFVLLSCIFGVIAIFKWLAAQKAAAKAPGLSNVRHLAPQRPMRRSSPVTEPTNVMWREPVMKENEVQPESTRAEAWSLELIQAIEWKRFEDVCQKFYELKGIRSECTPLGPDGGIDIRLFQDDNQPQIATAVVQCKAWGNSFVGVKPIRELLGVMVHEKIGKAFFMTSGSYSDEAKGFAVPNRITLIDGKMLLAMFNRLPDVQRLALLDFATAGDYHIPTCPSCGTKMRLIPGKAGRRDFWGCGSYPKCRQKLGARQGANAVVAYSE